MNSWFYFRVPKLLKMQVKLQNKIMRKVFWIRIVSSLLFTYILLGCELQPAIQIDDIVCCKKVYLSQKQKKDIISSIRNSKKTYPVKSIYRIRFIVLTDNGEKKIEVLADNQYFIFDGKFYWSSDKILSEKFIADYQMLR